MDMLALVEFTTEQSSLLLYQQIPVYMILQSFITVVALSSKLAINSLSDCDESQRLHTP